MKSIEQIQQWADWATKHDAAEDSILEMMSTLLREVDRLKVDCECHRIQAVDRGNSYQKATAEIDRLQSSLTLSREEWRREGMERAAEIVASTLLPNSMHAELVLRSNIEEAIRSEAKGERAECTWTLQDDETGAWASTCGELWSFIDGGPQENRVRFCHGCGKPVKAQPLLDTE